MRMPDKFNSLTTVHTENSRVGVFNALVNRASALQAGAEDINEVSSRYIFITKI